MWLGLLTVSVLVIAAVTTWMAWRVIRDDRARSEARVAALAAELAMMTESTAPQSRGFRLHPSTFAQGAPSGVEGQPEDLPPAGGSHETPPRPVVLRDAADVELARTTPTDMFSTTARPPRRGVRWAAAAVSGALVFATAIAVIVTFSLRAHSQTDTSSISRVEAARPIELMSLNHERSGDRLTVKGLVRNPANNAALSRVSAVVFLFDREGRFLTSGRANVDFLTLSPGEESLFVVEIPSAGAVGRYRVSFRDSDDAVLPHVDRRSGAMLTASKE